MASQSQEAQDWLRNPRRAIDLAGGGSQKHVLAIPSIIHKISTQFRHIALEVLLVHCSNKDQDLELAEALLMCVGALRPDLREASGVLRPALQRHHRTPSSSMPTTPKNLERVIIENADTICKKLRLCSDKSSLFSKESIEVDASLDLPTLETRIQGTAACLKALCRNAALSPTIFKDIDMMRVPIRFWLVTVFASKPGEVNPLVHEILFSCGGPYFADNDSSYFNLLVDENGGDGYSVAALLVSELKTMTKTKKDIKDAKKDLLYRDGFAALIHLNMMLLAPCSDESPRNPTLECDSTSILTTAVLKFIRIEEEDSARWQAHVFAYIMVIRDLLNLRDGARWAVDAIQAGVLTVILTVANLASRSGCSLGEEYVRSIQMAIRSFTLYLVHHSVVRAAANAVASIEPKNLKRLKNVPFFAEWMAFQSIVLERAVFMSQLGRKITPPERTLHCEFCLDTISLSELKKCERCKMSFYCSKACQTQDWRQSDHKITCAIEAESKSSMFLSTTDRFFMGHLAFYDIRRHMNSLTKVIEEQYPAIPVNELYFRVFYNAPERPIGMTIARIPEDSPEIFSRVAQQSKDTIIGPRLVEVLYAGGVCRRTRSFYFILPHNYSGVPELLEKYRDIASTAKVSFRSKVSLKQFQDDEPVCLSEEIDEVGAMLSFMQLTMGKPGDPAFFPLTFKYTWKDIEKAVLDFQSCWPFKSNGQGIL
ncbi:hypothetical protein SCHPADRAFT_1000906 [Schizopora paradoxa]|uniref:MYND-type domain-containing protein n=1 Tax=Schizopora paradoxa TaxID=27342 RepID=A0A0H2R9H5_9AGAM|nr:hypothetical protein SCHPADRAFT_1000906 [Schizopora paradoxa]